VARSSIIPKGELLHQKRLLVAPPSTGHVPIAMKCFFPLIRHPPLTRVAVRRSAALAVSTISHEKAIFGIGPGVHFGGDRSHDIGGESPCHFQDLLGRAFTIHFDSSLRPEMGAHDPICV
jgi:hypothetical protein